MPTALEPRVSAVVVHQPPADAVSPFTLDLCLPSALAEPWIDDLVIVDHDNPPEASSKLRAVQADRRDVRLVRADGVSARAAANQGAAAARGRRGLSAGACWMPRGVNGGRREPARLKPGRRSPWPPALRC